MAKYRVIADPDAQDGYEFRGGNLEFMRCKSPQSVIAGPSDTGKTFTGCAKLHLMCCAYAGSQHAMVRKVFASMAGSVCQTFGRVIKGAGVKVVGADSPRLYVYPNGSQVWVGGLDNPEKTLSSERDSIFVPQAEQLTLNEWELLSRAVSGRSAVVANPQLFGDCNPGGSRHWLREQAKSGKMQMFNARHRDNPSLYHADGSEVQEGETVGGVVMRRSGGARIQTLMDFTGVRRKRLFEGVWATSEGAVYDRFDAAVHARARSLLEMTRWFLALDEGYTNPQVILLVGADNDGRWHIFREFYVTHRLESEIVAQAKEWFFNPVGAAEGASYNQTLLGSAAVARRCEVAAVDDAAPGLIASLNASGVHAQGGKGLIGGNGKVKGGIDKIQDKLEVQGDSRPRLTVDPGCVNTINEFESYVWKPEKDVPVDADNHSMGALRYLSDVLNEPVGFREASGFRVGPVTEEHERFVAARL